MTQTTMPHNEYGGKLKGKKRQSLAPNCEVKRSITLTSLKESEEYLEQPAIVACWQAVQATAPTRASPDHNLSHIQAG